MSDNVAVSEKPWGDYTAADYTVQQWCDACLIHQHDGQATSKGQCKLPVRNPDGTLNRNGVHAASAALAGARGGVDASPVEKASAAKALLGLYAKLGETAPDSLKHSDAIDRVLEHHGVKGQKWGVRKDLVGLTDLGPGGSMAIGKTRGSAELTKKEIKTVSSATQAVRKALMDKTGMMSPNGPIAALNKAHRAQYKDTPATPGQLKEYDKKFTAIAEAHANAVAPPGTVARVHLDGPDMFLFVGEKTAVERAMSEFAHDDLTTKLVVIRDETGAIVEIRPSSLEHSDDPVDDVLSHFMAREFNESMVKRGKGGKFAKVAVKSGKLSEEEINKKLDKMWEASMIENMRGLWESNSPQLEDAVKQMALAKGITNPEDVWKDPKLTSDAMAVALDYMNNTAIPQSIEGVSPSGTQKIEVGLKSGAVARQGLDAISYKAVPYNGVNPHPATTEELRKELLNVQSLDSQDSSKSGFRFNPNAVLDPSRVHGVTHSDDSVDDILAHHGIKGQKWGVRRQTGASGLVSRIVGKKATDTANPGNKPDGLIPRTGSADQIHQDRIQKKIDTIGIQSLSNAEIQSYSRRLQLEKDVNAALAAQSAQTQAKADGFIKKFVKKQVTRQTDRVVDRAIDVAMEQAVLATGLKIQKSSKKFDPTEKLPEPLTLGKGLIETSKRMAPKKK